MKLSSDRVTVEDAPRHLPSSPSTPCSTTPTKPPRRICGLGAGAGLYYPMPGTLRQNYHQARRPWRRSYEAAHEKYKDTDNFLVTVGES
jgi:hypothetical protein